jgi:hypothetical protein
MVDSLLVIEEQALNWAIFALMRTVLPVTAEAEDVWSNTYPQPLFIVELALILKYWLKKQPLEILRRLLGGSALVKT